MALETIGKLLIDKGLEYLNKELAESGELKPGQAKEVLVKFVEESDLRQRYGIAKNYTDSFHDLFQKLRSESWYVTLASPGNYLKGTNAHDNWRCLTGRTIFEHNWYHEKVDGHPEADMFLRVHLHILLEAVGFSDLEYRDNDIEKHWGGILGVSGSYEYGKIWSAYFAFGPPEEAQFFSNAGTLYSARMYKYLETVFNMYDKVVKLLHRNGRIRNVGSYRDEYYMITLFASGAGTQDIQ